MERATARILIPVPGATPAPLPVVSQPQTTDNCPLMTDDCSLPAPIAAPQFSFILSPTRSATVSAFQSSTRQVPITNHQSPAPLFGDAALTAIAAATAYALEQRRKRKDEEARQRAEAQHEVARRNAAEEARKAQAYLLAQQSLNAYAQWDGWNTTVSIDLNYAEVATSGAGMKGNISKGAYVEVKPLQAALATTILVLTVAAALSGYPITKEQLCPAFGC